MDEILPSIFAMVRIFRFVFNISSCVAVFISRLFESIILRLEICMFSPKEISINAFLQDNVGIYTLYDCEEFSSVIGLNHIPIGRYISDCRWAFVLSQDGIFPRMLKLSVLLSLATRNIPLSPE